MVWANNLRLVMMFSQPEAVNELRLKENLELSEILGH